jgi:ectoine hydroxylase-related dioxygenase (phytanoyl-CoA dioxygenase family)
MGPEDMVAEGAIPCSVKAGSILLFSSDLWHHSKGNKTDQVRRAFIVSYQEATVLRGNADQWKVLRNGNQEL